MPAIELPGCRALGEIDGYLLQRLTLSFGFLVVVGRAHANRLDRALQRFSGQTVFAGKTTRVALVVGEREQKQFAGNELVAALGRFLVGQVEKIVEVARDRDLAALPLDLRQTPDGLGQRRLERRDVDASAGEERPGAAVLLLKQGGEQMLRLDEAVVVAQRQALRVGERLLELGRQLVQTHGIPREPRI